MSRFLPFARYVSLAAVPPILLAPGLAVGPTLDAAVFVVVGMRVRSGGMPYRDVWDHKPPGIYIVHALSQALLPFADPWLLAWLLTAAVTSTAIVLLFWVLARRGSMRWAWGWSLAAAVLVSAYSTAAGGGFTEPFALLPLLVALALLAGGLASPRRVALIGVALAAACSFSVFAIPEAAALALATVLRPDPVSLTVRRVAVRVGVLAAGGALVAVPVLGWLVLGGALPDAFDQLVTYSGAYRAASGRMLDLIEPGVEFAFAAPFVIAGLFGLAGRVRARDPLAWLAPLWIVLFGAVIWFEGRLYPHYWILVTPAIVLLAMDGSGGRIFARPGAVTRPEPATPPGAATPAGAATSPGRAARPAAGLRASLAVACCLTLVLFSAGILTWASLYRLGHSAQDGATTRDVAAQVRAETSAGDRIFVWGDNPEVYLAASRDPASRFINELPMVTPGYWSPAKTAALLAEWRNAPPAAIVAPSDGVPLAPPPGWAPPANGDLRYYDTLDPLRAFVHERYRLAVTIGGTQVYVLVR